MKQTIIALTAVICLTVFLTQCKPKKEERQQSKAICYIYVHTRDTINQWAFGIRTIYISKTVNDKPVWDTAWEYPTKFRYNAKGRVKDSTGRPMVFQDSLVFIGKDSVKWQGIEGVPVDSILRSFRPRGWKAPKVQSFAPPKTITK